MTTEESHCQSSVDTLEEKMQVGHCHLFSPGPDFTIACSCDECLSKIIKLKEFEDNLKSKRQLIFNYLAQLGWNESLCLTLMCAAQSTATIFDLIFWKLQSLFEKSGVPFPYTNDASTTTPHDVCLKLFRLLKDNGLVNTTSSLEFVGKDYVTCITSEIPSGIYYYKRSKANNKAYDLLQHIDRLECDHKQKTEAAKIEGKSLDLSISIQCVEHQFELVKQLPVEDLYREVEELIPMVCPIHENREMFGDARAFITKSSVAMIRERKKFWHRFQENSSTVGSKTVGKGHNSNGLNETLDLLLNMVDMFKSGWEKQYDHFFNSFDRSNPKRLRIG